ncbi:hypothetical protein FH972_022865 [Carpinus fangiana]|uniref:Uncharacterized protein n=1 Tax=Carpinus fangiana TaxID=176857 RepID=A0A5N6KTH3_9ROSI|nr:hypothetical protein FH972_022865 [Carpinus fangiana]
MAARQILERSHRVNPFLGLRGRRQRSGRFIITFRNHVRIISNGWSRKERGSRNWLTWRINPRTPHPYTPHQPLGQLSGCMASCPNASIGSRQARIRNCMTIRGPRVYVLTALLLPRNIVSDALRLHHLFTGPCLSLSKTREIPRNVVGSPTRALAPSVR